MNASARDQVTTLLRRARETPDAVWLTQPIEGREITFSWSRAANEIARVAAALRALELPSGSRIGITGKNTAHWMLADLAVAMAGQVSVGIYPKQAIATTRYILEHSDVRAVFLGPPIAGDRIDVREAVPTSVPTISLPYAEAPLGDHRWDDLVAANEPLSDYVARGPDELYWLVYTSGTTGNPKGVMLTVANMLFAIENYRTLLPLGDRPRFFSYLPLAHLFERAAVEAMSLEVGGHVYFLESPVQLDAQLRRASPDFFIGVPLVYGRLKTAILGTIPERILDLAFRIPSLRAALRRRIISKLGLRNAKVCITGGASTPVPTLRFYESLDLPLHQAYGMSESGAYGTIEIPGARRVGSVGRPAPGATLKISADGEILLRHGAVMSGYFREPELTKDAFTADGYLRTGDKGHIDDDGYVFVTGRIKDLFKTPKGKYVAPAPIEGAFTSNAAIDQVCLVGADVPQPIMVVTLTELGKTRERGDIARELGADLEAMNATLETHERVAKCLVVDGPWSAENGLLTPTSKVRRSAVEAKYRSSIERAAATQRQLKIVWE